MSSIEISDFANDEAPAISGVVAALQNTWQQIVHRHEERRLFARLSRLDPHLARDMGFDPARIQDGLWGTWDEVYDNRWRRLDNK